jgi:RNA polymerase-binding transcription factor DksA
MQHGADVFVADATRRVLDDDLRAIFRRKLDDELRAVVAPRGSVDDRDVERALDSKSQETVDSIRGAMDRLDGGTFGICTDCGSFLSVARLMALPHAARCLECQSEAERRR